jgi:hypothetical protein
MKYAKLMFALAVTMLPMFAAAQLGSNDRIVTKVPFEFVVGKKTIPAGECVVQAGTADLKTVIIRNGEAKVGLFSTILPIETVKAAGNYALVFHQYGDRYFLWGMKIEGTRVMYRLPESKAEAELRAQNVPATDKILLAYLQ